MKVLKLFSHITLFASFLSAVSEPSVSFKWTGRDLKELTSINVASNFPESSNISISIPSESRTSILLGNFQASQRSQLRIEIFKDLGKPVDWIEKN